MPNTTHTKEAATASVPPKNDLILGFDFGTKRIGVAVGNALSGSAQALTTLHHQGEPDWEGVVRLVNEWRPRALVVGMPLLQDGGEQPMTAHARKFIGELGNLFSLPVHEVDERFSSIEAEVRLREQRASGARRRRLAQGDTDSMAAQVILESWLADNAA